MTFKDALVETLIEIGHILIATLIILGILGSFAGFIYISVIYPWSLIGTTPMGIMTIAFIRWLEG